MFIQSIMQFNYRHDEACMQFRVSLFSDSFQGFKFEYKEDWGEALIGLASPSVFVLDVQGENVYNVDTVQHQISCGQV